MMTSTNSKGLSSKRIKWIREQGYFSYSDQQIRELAFGNRFAYKLCTVILFLAVAMANIPLLVLMNLVALMSIFLPNHPFDYIYNNLIRKWTKGPKVPPRSPQLVFACTLASCFIASTIYFFMAGMTTAGYLMGFHVVIIASLVSLIDLCIPSRVYNFITEKLNQSQAKEPTHSN